MGDMEFRTGKGYRRESTRELTEAMEDYLEMICRLAPEDGYVRISRLASRLHVQPSSASKMAVHLRELGYVDFQRYGLVVPTEKGRAAGRYLLHRHAVLVEFLRLLNGTEDVLVQAEQLEHFFDEKTVKNLAVLVEKMRNNDAESTAESVLFQENNPKKNS